jgi:hypothetical protein
MFAWLNRCDTKKLTTLLASALAGWEQISALCQRLAGIVDTQAAQLAETRAENRRLWAALGAAPELQQYIAVGCSEAQAKVALALGRSTN